jgi:hypothetical protein
MTRIQLTLLTGLVLGAAATPWAAPNPHFHLFIAFGQSNMEGAVNTPEAQDKTVNARFLEDAAVTCNANGRTLTQGVWTPAIAPIVRCDTKISPLDWFGRTMTDSLPSTDTVGVVVAAVGGTKIEGFDLDKYQAYYAAQASWMQAFAANYGGNPYGRLITVAKQAQERGIVRGILLHQGESNVGDATWATEVKKIYEKMLSDLGLTAANAPLLAGEVAPTGVSSGANTMIDKLPQTISTATVVSAQGLTTTNGDGQNVHFDAPSYRTLGKRYAAAMMPLLRKQNVGIATQPLRHAAQTATAWTVFDLKGAPVARFAGTETDREAGWNRARAALPAGIYWIRPNTAEAAQRVFNSL